MKNDFYKDKFFELVALCRREIGAGGRIVVTGHDMPDNDSIISAVMLRYLLTKVGVEAVIKFGTRPDNVTLRDQEELGNLDGISFDGFDECDRLILVCLWRNIIFSSTSYLYNTV